MWSMKARLRLSSTPPCSRPSTRPSRRAHRTGGDQHQGAVLDAALRRRRIARGAPAAPARAAAGCWTAGPAARAQAAPGCCGRAERGLAEGRRAGIGAAWRAAVAGADRAVGRAQVEEVEALARPEVLQQLAPAAPAEAAASAPASASCSGMRVRHRRDAPRRLRPAPARSSRWPPPGRRGSWCAAGSRRRHCSTTRAPARAAAAPPAARQQHQHQQLVADLSTGAGSGAPVAGGPASALAPVDEAALQRAPRDAQQLRGPRLVAVDRLQHGADCGASRGTAGRPGRPAAAGARRWPPAGCATGSGRAPRRFSAPTISERSIRLRSSRTLPGQSYCCRKRISWSLTSIGGTPSCGARVPTKCATSSGMSSLCARSGGSVISTTCSR